MLGLKRFWVSNFRNLVNVEFRPAGVNLLIGPNNVGKTNLCAAMRFLSLTASRSLEVAAKEAVGETWNLSNVYVSDPSIRMEADCAISVAGNGLVFSYALELRPSKKTGDLDTAYRLVEERLVVRGEKFDARTLIESRSGHTLVRNRAGAMEEPDDPGQDWIEDSPAAESTFLSRVYGEQEGSGLVGHFKRFIQSWSYFSLNPHSLRSSAVARDESRLVWDGGNLSRAFFGVHNENPRLEQKIIEMLRAFDPKLDLFSYIRPDPGSVYMYMEDRERHRFSTQSISDGTLSFMAMAYLILADAQSPRANPPLIILEEPENGIYVGHLKPLLEKIEPDGKFGQFIFTSQNPYFIDLFDSHLDGVHVFRPGRPSAALVKPDPERVGKLLKEMPLGEMHFREMLEVLA